MKEECMWNAGGYCGSREVDSDLCYSKCSHFEVEVPITRKNCPECIDPMDALTDPNNNEGWIHLNPVQEDLSPWVNSIPPIPDPESLSFSPRYRLGSSLDEAKQIITGERQDSYGNPEDSFSKIADYWTHYLNLPLGTCLSPKDVAHMMILFKIARCNGQSSKRDNYIDIQGYAAIAADRLIPKENSK